MQQQQRSGTWRPQDSSKTPEQREHERRKRENAERFGESFDRVLEAFMDSMGESDRKERAREVPEVTEGPFEQRITDSDTTHARGMEIRLD